MACKLKRYFGGFDSAEDIKAQFDTPNGDFPVDDEVLFAAYEGASYEGDAIVIFRRDGKLYEAHGSHCSCFGLEGQWSPEETSWDAIKMRPELDAYSYAEETRTAYAKLLGAYPNGL